MIKPSKVKFIYSELKKSFNSLPDSDPVKRKDIKEQ